MNVNENDKFTVKAESKFVDFSISFVDNGHTHENSENLVSFVVSYLVAMGHSYENIVESLKQITSEL